MDICRHALRCLHCIMSSCHFPEKSASLNTSHETGLCAGASTGKRACRTVTSGSPPLPDISSRISLHYVPSLCLWHAQWKIPESLEQMSIVSPSLQHGFSVFDLMLLKLVSVNIVLEPFSIELQSTAVSFEVEERLVGVLEKPYFEASTFL